MNKQKENSNRDQTKKTPIKRYAFAQKEGDDFSCIKLLDGRYEGIIYKYDKVAFEKAPLDGSDILLRFTYEIMTNPNDEDILSDDFRNYIGDILVEIVDQQLKEGKVDFGK